MNAEEIQRLVKIVEQSDIAELEFSQWGRKIRISKYGAPMAGAAHNASAYYAVASPPPAATAAPAPDAAAAKNAAAPAKDATATGEEFRSPMVGTFYRSPSPEADPYIKGGDTVQKGQVLCIIEAMKLMNEVEAEFPCKIIKILVENGQPVEYNQPLFLVERLS